MERCLIKEGGVLRRCRLGSLPLNRKVQVGEQRGVSGFPQRGGHAHLRRQPSTPG